jgi:hypothetical protein
MSCSSEIDSVTQLLSYPDSRSREREKVLSVLGFPLLYAPYLPLPFERRALVGMVVCRHSKLGWLEIRQSLRGRQNCRRRYRTELTQKSGRNFQGVQPFEFGAHSRTGCPEPVQCVVEVSRFRDLKSHLVPPAGAHGELSDYNLSHQRGAPHHLSTPHRTTAQTPSRSTQSTSTQNLFCRSFPRNRYTVLKAVRSDMRLGGPGAS